MSVPKTQIPISQIQIKLERIITYVENAKNVKDIKRLYRELVELYALIQSVAM